MKKNHKPGRARARGRRTVAPSPQDHAATEVPGSQRELSPLAIEVWRLGRRISAAPGTSERIADSHARLVRACEDAGIRVDDPLGRQFIDGTHAEIIDMPDGADLVTDRIVVTDVLRPAVYVDGACVVMPQVILGRSEQKEGQP